jgi:hypothetical protein
VLRQELPPGAADRVGADVLAAARDLDTYRVAGLLTGAVTRIGVLAAWQRICLPLLTELTGHTAGDVAVEHVLSEGIRISLDGTGRDGDPPVAARGIVLAGAEAESHCLALHALAAALREQGRGVVLLGADLPWPALAVAVRRVRPHTAVVWAQTTRSGRSDQLARIAAGHPATRIFAAGPGWPATPPAPALRLASLAEAVDACQPPD